MYWEPSIDMDREIRGWMKLKGWEVTRTNYDQDREVYDWRSDVKGGPSHILRISREVLDAYPPFALVEHLSRLRVAHAIRTQPHIRWILVHRGTSVALEEN